MDSDPDSYREETVKTLLSIGKPRINFLILIMNRSVLIFKSFQEQEQFHKDLMRQTTVADRFRKLYQMQELTKLLHPVADKSRKIQIRKWTS